jgi:hypothetical protein
MAKRSTKYLPGRCTNAQQTYEKMFDIISHQGIENQNQNQKPPHTY